jgi:hypothetical protein
MKPEPDPSPKKSGPTHLYSPAAGMRSTKRDSKNNKHKKIWTEQKISSFYATIIHSHSTKTAHSKLSPILDFTPRGELGPQGLNLSSLGNVHFFIHP